MLTKLYLDTTNPNLRITDLFSAGIFPPLLVSVIFHTLLYVGFANAVSYIFYNKALSGDVNFRLVAFLLVIMFLGFFGRVLHVKEIYAAYGGDMEKTRAHLDHLYVGWIFLS